MNSRRTDERHIKINHWHSTADRIDPSSLPESVTDSAGITWTGRVINNRSELGLSDYQASHAAYLRYPYRGLRPSKIDPVLASHLPIPSDD